MSTDLLSTAKGLRRQSQPQPPLERPPGDPHGSSPTRRSTLALLAVSVVAVAGAAALLLPDAGASRELDSKLTHTITRGDLIVTVTEQGTLESSDNTEIKCKVRGQSTVIWVIEGGTEVQPGAELVRLDTLALEDAISERKKFAHLTRSGAERAKADVAAAELAISEYLEGRYRAQLMRLEKDLTIAESDLTTTQNSLDHAKMLFERGYVSELIVEQSEFNVKRTQLEVDAKKIQIDVLKKYTKEMQLETLNGELKAAKAKLAAEAERAKMDAERRDLAIEELEYCVIKAEKHGMVIHPSAAQWRNTPEIEEGATVHKDQVLLLMPDLSKMQVKVGVHESIVERIIPGLDATITLPDKTLDGQVASVAAVRVTAGWWTGNVVKYDTIIELPEMQELKPGMSAEVEIVMARHKNVLKVPVAAVLEAEEGDLCWVVTERGPSQRTLELGDTNDEFIVVNAGLQEGEKVVLDPLANIEEAQTFALRPTDDAQQRQLESEKSVDGLSVPAPVEINDLETDDSK